MKDPIIQIILESGSTLEGNVSQFVELEKHPNLKKWVSYILRSWGGKILYAGHFRGEDKIAFAPKAQVEREKKAAQACFNFVENLK